MSKSLAVGALLLLLSPAACLAADSSVEHVFAKPARAGAAKAQIRALVREYPMTEADWKQLAARLAAKHRGYGSYLVQFFDDPGALRGWDGTGRLRDADWPSWLGRATVETDSAGRLVGSSFRPARSAETGLERGDVVAP